VKVNPIFSNGSKILGHRFFFLPFQVAGPEEREHQEEGVGIEASVQTRVGRAHRTQPGIDFVKLYFGQKLFV
jgi:hypothetical protein